MYDQNVALLSAKVRNAILLRHADCSKQSSSSEGGVLTRDPLILVADGRRSIRMALSHALRSAGFYVFAAENGLDALRIAGDALPEAMLVGEDLLDFSGDSLRAFAGGQAHLKDVPVLLLSEILEGADHGADLGTVVEVVADRLWRARQPNPYAAA